MAVFVSGFVTVGIYGTFNIDGRLALQAGLASFVEMLLVGTVIGAMYRPAGQRRAAAASV